MVSALKLSWISNGRTSEPGIIKDATNALDEMTKKLDEDEKRKYSINNRNLRTCLPRIFWSKNVNDLKANTSPRGNLQPFIDVFIDHGIGQMIVSEYLFPLYLLDNLNDYKEAIRHIVLGMSFVTM